MAPEAGRRAELLANGDLLVTEAGHTRRATKGTGDHQRLRDSAAAGELDLGREVGRFGGPQSPPHPAVAELFARLGVGNASPVERRRAAARAAYAGRLRVTELDVLRRAGLIPYDYEAGGERKASDG
jgi:hypothetical protein